MQNEFEIGIKILEIQPLYNQILTTADKYEEKLDIDNKTKLIRSMNVMAGQYKLYQKVVAVGPNVRQLKVGDVIAINPKRYFRQDLPETEMTNVGDKQKNTPVKIVFPTMTINGVEHLTLYEDDASYIIKKYE